MRSQMIIQKSQMMLAWGTGNPGWSRTQPELVYAFQQKAQRSLQTS